MLVVNGMRYAFNRTYVLGGGEVPLTSLGINLQAPIPDACPGIIFLVGSIAES